ncbi:hypothetical protein Pelo_9335 [Pelomyxa schiedti]|nr:hypothetical protein Pelo_9335 [Pelomyxa schiedti]
MSSSNGNKLTAPTPQEAVAATATSSTGAPTKVVVSVDEIVKMWNFLQKAPNAGAATTTATTSTTSSSASILSPPIFEFTPGQSLAAAPAYHFPPPSTSTSATIGKTDSEELDDVDMSYMFEDFPSGTNMPLTANKDAFGVLPSKIPPESSAPPHMDGHPPATTDSWPISQTSKSPLVPDTGFGDLFEEPSWYAAVDAPEIYNSHVPHSTLSSQYLYPMSSYAKPPGKGKKALPKKVKPQEWWSDDPLYYVPEEIHLNTPVSILSLPFDCLLNIFCFLDVFSLLQCALVCKKWAVISRQNDMPWRRLLQRNFCLNLRFHALEADRLLDPSLKLPPASYRHLLVDLQRNRDKVIRRRARRKTAQHVSHTPVTPHPVKITASSTGYAAPAPAPASHSSHTEPPLSKELAVAVRLVAFYLLGKFMNYLSPLPGSAPPCIYRHPYVFLTMILVSYFACDLVQRNLLIGRNNFMIALANTAGLFLTAQLSWSVFSKISWLHPMAFLQENLSESCTYIGWLYCIWLLTLHFTKPNGLRLRRFLVFCMVFGEPHQIHHIAAFMAIEFFQGCSCGASIFLSYSAFLLLLKVFYWRTFTSIWKVAVELVFTIGSYAFYKTLVH